MPGRLDLRRLPGVLRQGRDLTKALGDEHDLRVQLPLTLGRNNEPVKAALYARHRIPEYWIVNVEAETVEVFTEPRPRSGAYRRVRTVAKQGANVLMTHLVSCLVEANGNRPRADAGTLRLLWVG